MSASLSVTPRRLVAAAAVATFVVGAVALPASAADRPSARPDRAQVAIGAVQYDAQGRHDRSNRFLNREWVEITNNGRRDVNLNGWTLSDRDGNTYTFRDYRLDGRATVRVHTGVGRDSKTDVYQDRRNSVWDRNADTATLRNARGRFIDAAAWGDDRHGDHRGDDRHGDHRGDDRHGDHRGDDRHGDHRGDDRHGDHRGGGDLHPRGDDHNRRGDHRR
ncbi:lamin tail domain-containing protein [Streptomyces sp. NPDC101151]|uniref:lamin tail domain-containing protein n=1 Tax=Streptomyces sp. NPDC101151 TaxID=3366115 RepID=UPI00382F3A0D